MCKTIARRECYVPQGLAMGYATTHRHYTDDKTPLTVIIHDGDGRCGEHLPPAQVEQTNQEELPPLYSRVVKNSHVETHQLFWVRPELIHKHTNIVNTLCRKRHGAVDFVPNIYRKLHNYVLQ